LAMAYAQLGQTKQADAEVGRVLAIDPAYGDHAIADLQKTKPTSGHHSRGRRRPQKGGPDRRGQSHARGLLTALPAPQDLLDKILDSLCEAGLNIAEPAKTAELSARPPAA